MTSRLATSLAVVALAGIAACGPTRPVAPGAQVDAAVAAAAGAVDAQPQRAQTAAVPTTATSAKAPERRGLFGRMLRRDTAANAADTSPDVSPIADVSPDVVDAASEEALAKLAEAEAEGEAVEATEVAEAEAEPQSKRRWLFGKRQDQAAQTEPKPELKPEPEAPADAPSGPAVEVAAVETAVEEAATEPQKKRRFGLFQRRDKTSPAADPAPKADAEAGVAEAEVAQEITEVAAVEPAPKPKKERKGLFARRDKAKDAEDVDTAEPVVLAAAAAAGAEPEPRSKRKAREASVPAGVVLPFGEVGLACGLPKRKMGKEIDKTAGYRLYDTNPGGIGPRTFFLTGLKDGCARQFTGAVALFGSLEVYEVLHFAGGGGRATGATDAAYRKLRSSSCPAPRKGPCNARGMKKLSKSTAFVSVYASKGRSTHLELLLNNGKLVAEARK